MILSSCWSFWNSEIIFWCFSADSSLLSSEITMLVIESRFFFHDLFHEKSTFSNLANSGLIRRNLAISRINWSGNNFFFFLRFFLFFLLWILSFEKSDSESEIWILSFSLFVSGWMRSFYFRNFAESNSAFFINGGNLQGLFLWLNILNSFAWFLLYNCSRSFQIEPWVVVLLPQFLLFL